MAEAKCDFFDKLQRLTESFLTWRKRTARIKREKQKAKNPIVDWLEAILWAVGMVLLANQYLLQAYVIPSGSMIDTLLVGDRIFVNKLVYGPELLPGVAKLPSIFTPQRNDIIIFENPAYTSRGPVFDIAQRIIFMLTISLVDIDRDERGQPRAHFLIKRAVGASGDRFTMEQGEMKIRFPGDDQWTDERSYAEQRGWKHNISRLVDKEMYPAFEMAGRADAWQEGLRLPAPERLITALQSVQFSGNIDIRAYERARIETLRTAMPYNRRYAEQLARDSLWYVPEGRIFPMGDNRDNSRDGRDFGPVRKAKVLGKGGMIFWPMQRINHIR